MFYISTKQEQISNPKLHQIMSLIISYLSLYAQYKVFSFFGFPGNTSNADF